MKHLDIQTRLSKDNTLLTLAVVLFHRKKKCRYIPDQSYTASKPYLTYLGYSKNVHFALPLIKAKWKIPWPFHGILATTNETIVSTSVLEKQCSSCFVLFIVNKIGCVFIKPLSI